MKFKFELIPVMLAALAVGCASNNDSLTSEAEFPSETGTPVVANQPGSEHPIGAWDEQGQGQEVAREDAEGVAGDEEGLRDASVDGMTGASTEEPQDATAASREERGQSRESKAAQAKLRKEQQASLDKALALNHLHHINRKEIAMAEMAKNKSQDPEVTKVADRILADHQKLAERVQAAAKQENITLNDFQMSTYDAAAMEKLRELEGRNFDQAFLQTMNRSHEMALADLQRLKSSVKSGQVASVLDEAIPSIRQHERLSTTGASRMQ